MSARSEGRPRRRQEEDNESYYVSMSDLMAGVLFLFIIMLTNYALLLRAAPAITTAKQAKPVQRSEPMKLNETVAGGGAPRVGPPVLDARTAALLAIADQLKARGIAVTVDPAVGALRFANQDLFAPGGPQVSGNGRVALNALAGALQSVLPCFIVAETARPAGCPSGVGRIGAAIVEGHSDTGAADDWSRSVGQGSAAFQALLQAQPSLQTLQSPAAQPLLSVAGYGPSRPVQPGTDPAQRTVNSRLDVRLVLVS